MKNITTLLLFALLSYTGCEKIDSYLPLAKPYTVVGEHDIQLDVKNREAKIWYITSDADSFEEFAQTTILAAYEIYKKNKDVDLVEVMMIPNKELIATGVYYALASYSPDKKGALGLSGVDLSAVTYSKWFVRAADKPLSGKELTIANLWYKHQQDFPAKQVFSSLTYDQEELTQFIADTMQIGVSEVEMPFINLMDYKELKFIK